jgi:hypothetical protein
MKIRFALPLTLIAGFSFFACGTAGQPEEIAGSKDNAGRQEEIAGPKGILDPGGPTFGDVESHATTVSGLCDGTGDCGDINSGCVACAVSGPCEGLMDACESSAECVDYMDCVGACADTMCSEACKAQEPEGAALYEAVVVCVVIDECPNDCGGGPGSGGGPGGPPGSCDNTGECGDSTSGGCVECAVFGECGGQRLACQNDDECIDYVFCIVECIDDPCEDDCAAQEPEGAALYGALVECVACDACASDCAAEFGEVCL